ncbi:MAG: nuclear transport factor 2 family protein [Confluentimicrobium sp.]|jgi:hypothetical protein|uniref:nuclear transport factor 2 family protein n=1 Tax=Actibacterium sp. TaxID=1872125 RepID=UPI00050E132A|nr:nuclear transport factor 2 family protein [Actibacterium sp.]KGB83320.1 hypothetical protein JT55_03165 [Rhodovulum sp. NI22]MBC57351.1 nuclear transport factor 2 family protein [Actibacterium sp.]MDY6860901.1 nuclear transport factor 2 family protein [Pseudomonadota bacterium]|tara:strand:- start:10357 stop:10863 length:507 start_codon:yes stop_codon:yes gene_type:complete
MTTLEDFTLSEEKKAEICNGLTAPQEKAVRHWMALHEVLNRGDFDAVDDFFHPEMTYSNPNRPDLSTYATWKTSPMKLYELFPPCVYRTVGAWGRGDDEVTVLCHHWGKHTGGTYYGKEPTGNEINVWWYSTLKMKEGKIFHIYSISDILTMVMDLEVIPRLPANPYG